LVQKTQKKCFALATINNTALAFGIAILFGHNNNLEHGKGKNRTWKRWRWRERERKNLVDVDGICHSIGDLMEVLSGMSWKLPPPLPFQVELTAGQKSGNGAAGGEVRGEQRRGEVWCGGGVVRGPSCRGGGGGTRVK
jgi:hypothetical protein